MEHQEMVNLLNDMAVQSLHMWGVEPGSTAQMINLSENATYRVDQPTGAPTILRIHREGYHTDNAIECELAWIEALRVDGAAITPIAIPGLDGKLIQKATVDGLPGERRMVMFELVDGVEPDESQDLVGPFEHLGEITAQMHLHTINWDLPHNFERLVWDAENILSPEATWGYWHNAPAMNGEYEVILAKLVAKLYERLNDYGKGAERYGLIHADMRLANLLVSDSGTRVIDFDDCGLGWYLYDLATAMSFFEDSPKVPELTEAWLRGYQKVRKLSDEDLAEIDTFIMLRRMALTAWIGSHSETDLAKEQGPAFTRGTVELAQKYLDKFGG